MVLHQSQILPRECSRLVGNGDFISLSVNLKVLLVYAKQMNEPLDDLVKHCKMRLLFDKPRGLRTMLKGETHSKRWMIRRICGDVAQLGERSVRNAEVVGSIPIVSTT